MLYLVWINNNINSNNIYKSEGKLNWSIGLKTDNIYIIESIQMISKFCLAEDPGIETSLNNLNPRSVHIF